MFEYIYQWIQNLAFYMILVTAVIHVLPENNYQKYIRFFSGLILVILLASPVIKLFGVKENFTEFYRDAEYEQTQKEIEHAAEYFKEFEALPASGGGEE